MILVGLILAGLAAVVAFDVVQRRHAVLRNFPLIGHFRYLLESVGPELRQYIVTNNTEERPFSRDQRRPWRKSSAAAASTFWQSWIAPADTWRCSC